MRSALRALTDLLLPGGCGGCARPGPGWCAWCAGTCGPPRRVLLAGGPPVRAAGRYGGPLRTALLAYKERGRRDLAAPLAGLLAAVLAADGGPEGLAMGGGPAGLGPAAAGGAAGPCWLVPAPSRRSAARRRGGDHVAGLCAALAGQLAAGGREVLLARALAVHGRARDSVGLGAAERTANLAGRLRPIAAGLPPPGTAVLLVDDVVTTGATLRACRDVLVGEGVVVSGALVLCDATT